MSDLMLTAARKLGEAAARLGHPVTGCPYRPGSQHAIERAAARAYVAAWLRWSPSAPTPDVSDGDGDGDQAADVDQDGDQ